MYITYLVLCDYVDKFIEKFNIKVGYTPP